MVMEKVFYEDIPTVTAYISHYQKIFFEYSGKFINKSIMFFQTATNSAGGFCTQSRELLKAG